MVNSDLEGFKTPSNNVYFENGVLYSYGSHYPMATKLTVNTGENYREIILVNSNKSSVTTEKHKSQLRYSRKPNQWLFNVPNILDPKARENIEFLENQIVDAIDAVLRGLSYQYISDVFRAIEGQNQFADAFKLKPFKLDVEFQTVLTFLSIESEKRHEKRNREKLEKLEKFYESERVGYADQVKLWYSCSNTVKLNPSHFGLDYDPVRVNGEKVETPRGVELPLKEARRFAMAFKSGFVRVGDKVDQFEVLSIGEKYIQIGCHKLNIEQALNAVLGG
jgi:hypothetical protein